MLPIAFQNHLYCQIFANHNNCLLYTSKRVLKVHACMEATGIYGEALANFLYDKEHLISVVNPMQIKSFAKSELLRTKTDKVDAQFIMRFCETIKPGLWEPEPIAILFFLNISLNPAVC